MVARIRPWASATPKTPKSDLGKKPLMIDPAPMKTRAKVPMASAVQRRNREDIARLSRELGGETGGESRWAGGQGVGAQLSRRKTSAALIPPKPKELLRMYCGRP